MSLNAPFKERAMKKTLVALALGFLGIVSTMGTGQACPAGGKSPSQPMVQPF